MYKDEYIMVIKCRGRQDEGLSPEPEERRSEPEAPRPEAEDFCRHRGRKRKPEVQAGRGTLNHKNRVRGDYPIIRRPRLLSDLKSVWKSHNFTKPKFVEAYANLLIEDFQKFG